MYFSCHILEISYWIGCYSNLLFMEVSFFFPVSLDMGIGTWKNNPILCLDGKLGRELLKISY
jgi:hypothetical protein